MLTFPTLITGTITDLRISSVDGTAFLDNCAALIPYADGNHQIEIYDSSNRMLKGVLKAAGTGAEGLGDDALASLDLTSGWSAYFSTIVDANTYSTTATAQGVKKNSFLIPDALYKFTAQFDISEVGSIWIANYSNSVFLTTGIPNNILTTKYFTSKDTGILINTIYAGSSTTNITSMTLPIVLTPSSSGATIVSSKGGAIYNFASKNASFTYNAASYRYAIYDTLKVVM